MTTPDVPVPPVTPPEGNHHIDWAPKVVVGGAALFVIGICAGTGYFDSQRVREPAVTQYDGPIHTSQSNIAKEQDALADYRAVKPIPHDLITATEQHMAEERAHVTFLRGQRAAFVPEHSHRGNVWLEVGIGSAAGGVMLLGSYALARQRRPEE